jgi:hypothetical protein
MRQQYLMLIPELAVLLRQHRSHARDEDRSEYDRMDRGGIRNQRLVFVTGQGGQFYSRVRLGYVEAYTVHRRVGVWQ